MTPIPTGAVLVVDDDDSMRQAIRRLLNAAGLKTQTFASAEALLDGGPVAGAACVVSDFKLPGLSGLELLTELRRQGHWPPVIVVTAHDTPELRAEAMRRGASAYLSKPFHGKDLLEAIDAAVDHGAVP
ncbi:response regulator transcription factor [Variovorax saccharolyticus]|uniref:response regulator transcription factor n=1 Tax=Variovorax saccharolyticus TaxID=3053516 RepID=UPI002574DD65|nr:response regulator [Variovorax sp. J22R187]MDM0019517.1 response regulator [Variovorax sp. J22R187]